MTDNSKPQLLKASENKRFLIKEDGTPFFWLGDTAWELFHKLDREEAAYYLNKRAEQNFNVIQAVALAERDGLRTGDAYGKKPLLKNKDGKYDPILPDIKEKYSYWDHVDYIVNKAEELGLYIGLLPTWGDKYNKKWGKGPVIFNRDNAKAYGYWIGKRFKNKSNIIWILGGDRPLEKQEHYDIIKAMAKGIKKGDGGKHLITFHPPGGKSSTSFLPNEDILDFDMIQSSHGLNIDNYKYVKEDYKKGIKPVLDGEPRYEDHPIGFKPENGYFDDVYIRQAAYWAVFAGGFGHTYGHHSIWSMNTKPAVYCIMSWRKAMLRPGGKQVQYLRKLMESRPFLERVPDQSLLTEELSGFNHLQATKGESYAFIYTPTGLPVEVNMGKISGIKVKAYWYNPRCGACEFAGEFTNKGTAKFIPVSSGRGQDWVLVLDDADKNFPLPGKNKY